MKTELKIGQVLWSCSLKEFTIEKIGNKYFTCNETRTKFTITTLRGHNEFSTNGMQLYIDRVEVENLREKSALSQKIRNYFSGCGNVNLPLEILREINLIITKQP